MIVILVAALFVTMAGVACLIGYAADRQAGDATHRWGAESSTRESDVGEGAFRTAPLSDEQARRLPTAVRVVGVLGAMLSMLTPVTLAPLVAGLGFSIVDFEGRPWLGFFAFVVALPLFIGSVFVHRACVELLTNELGAGERAQTIGLAISGVCAAGGVVLAACTETLPDMTAATTGGLGVLLAFGFGLWFAGRWVASTQASMSPPELAALERPLRRR